MEKVYKDNSYYNVVNDIIYDNNFIKLDNDKHHGISRLEHSQRVSYYSYKITKFLRLNYKDTARGALLHDFYLNEDLTEKQLKISAFVHAKKALENSDKYFYLSELEKDIIYKHMFPLNITRIPKYMESWIVSSVDKIVAVYEFSLSFKRICALKYEHAMILLLILMSQK